MRSIDADAIIEVMKKCAEKPENAQALLCYRYAQRILEEAPTVEPSPQWHKVESKEDLPKESDTYIVYLRQGTKVETPEWMGGEPLSYVTEMAFDRGQMLWRVDDDAYNAVLSLVDTEREFHVTHWMEKPNPPKEIINE